MSSIVLAAWPGRPGAEALGSPVAVWGAFSEESDTEDLMLVPAPPRVHHVIVVLACSAPRPIPSFFEIIKLLHRPPPSRCAAASPKLPHKTLSIHHRPTQQVRHGSAPADAATHPPKADWPGSNPKQVTLIVRRLRG